MTSGGAIPETGDYRVVLDPDGITVGSVHEDFAVEATAGDIFLLGTHSWRVVKVETGTVRVHDAGDLPPTIPFWLGEAPARTAELSDEVGALRAELEPLLAEGDGEGARALVRERAGVSEEVADQVVAYLGAGLAALGALPTRERIVIERVFDESEGTQLIVHAPYGGRINRALGLALRKRFCVSFDFELQAAADDDTVVLSLGPQHSFPLAQVPKMLSSGTATDVLTQAILLHPMLAARWRWNLTRALVVPRSRGGKRRPIHIQRMEADDLLAAAWPALAACQENAAPGPVPVPDHVLVRQSVADCLTEPLDAVGLVGLLADLEAGRVGVHLVESSEPSPLAHGILTGRPVHLPRRRPARGAPHAGGTRSVAVWDRSDPTGSQWRHPSSARSSPRPWPRCSTRSSPGRATRMSCTTSFCRWCCADRWRPGSRGSISSGWTVGPPSGEAHGSPPSAWPWARPCIGSLTDPMVAADDALAECVGGHLEISGPVTVEQLVADAPLPGGSILGAPVTEARARTGLARLEAAGLGHRTARRPLVRAPSAGPPACRQPEPAPPSGRAGQPLRLRAISRLLAACRRRNPGRGPIGTAGRHRAAPGPRGGGRRMGAERASGPGRRLRPPVAR